MSILIGEGVIPIRARDDTAAGVAQAKRRLADIRAEAKLDADISACERKIRIVESELRQLDSMDVSPEVTARTEAAQNRLRQLRREAEALGRLRIAMRADVDTGSARSNLRGVGAEAAGADGHVRRLSGTGRGLGSSFSSSARVPGILLGIASAAGAAGAALGVLPALAGSLGGIGGVLIGAFSGVGDALKGYQADQAAASAAGRQGAAAAQASGRQIRDAQQAVTEARENASRVAVQGAAQIADAERSAARAAADGARSVSDAKREQARTARESAEAVADAERRQRDVAEQGAAAITAASGRVEDALESQERAQDDLTDAYRDAGRALDDLREKVSDYALDQEGAAIRVAEAEDELRKTMADSAATALDRRKAEYELATAKERVSDLTREQARSTSELADAERKGIAGSDVVVAAQGRLSDAVEATRDAQGELAQVTATAARANQDAARDTSRVMLAAAEANSDAARATARAQQEAAEANADAARGVREAQQSAAQASRDAAAQIADALRGVQDATEAQAASAVGAAGATSKYAEAMAKLTPEGRAFVRQLIAMKPLVDGLSRTSQRSFLPGLTDMLRDSEGLFPIFDGHLERTGTIMGDTARRSGELFKSPEFKNNLRDMLDSSLPITQALGDGLISLTSRIVGFGAQMGPASKGFATFLTDTVAGFNGMLDELAPHAGDFQRIWEALGRIMRIVLPLVGELVGWLAEHLAPALESVAGFLERNEGSLGSWALAVGAAVLAVKGLNIANSVTRWCDDIVGGIGRIGRSADTSAGKARGLGGALKGALALAAVMAGAQFIGGAIQDQNAPDAPWRQYDRDGTGKLGTRERGRAVMAGDLGGMGSIMSKDLQESWSAGGDQWGMGNYGQAINTWLLNPEWAQKIATAQEGIKIIVRTKWNEIKTDLLNTAQGAGDGVLSKFDSRGLGGWLGSTWDGLRTRAGGAWTSLRDTVTGAAGGAWSGVTGWWGRTFADSDSWFNRTRMSVSGHMTGAKDWVVGRAGEAWGGITGWWGRTFTDSDSWFNRTRMSVGTHMSGARDWVVERAGNLWGGVTGWFSRTFTDSDSWFNRTRMSVGTHMSNARNWVVERAGNLWSGVSGWFGRTFTDSDSWFNRTRLSIGGHMSNARNWVVERAGNAWSGITGWWGRTFGDSNSTFARIRDAIGGHMGAARDRAVNWAGDAFRGVTGWFSRMWGDLGNLARGGVNGVIRGLNWLSDKGNIVLRFLRVPLIPGIPLMEQGGTLGPQMLASGGRVGAGFQTRGPQAIVGEGRSAYPEFVIPTDPQFRSRALDLYGALGGKLMASGGEVPQMAEGGILGWLSGAAASAWRGISGFVGGIGNKLGDVMSWMGDMSGGLLNDALAAIGDMVPGEPWRGMAGGAARGAFDGIKKLIENSFMVSGDPGGAGVQRWAPLVLRALAMMGQPASLLNVVLRRMNQESGGNPNIVNNWDSNARKGTPSGGLMQTILPTFRANHFPGTSWNMFDPLANILASMKYALRRYGSLAAAYNRPGGYAVGGRIPGAAGGARRDDTLLLAQPGERVLTQAQNDAFERLVAVLERGGTGGAGQVNNVTVQQIASDPQETGRFVALSLKGVA